MIPDVLSPMILFLSGTAMAIAELAEDLGLPTRWLRIAKAGIALVVSVALAFVFAPPATDPRMTLATGVVGGLVGAGLWHGVDAVRSVLIRPKN